jgi:hypothetical protein
MFIDIDDESREIPDSVWTESLPMLEKMIEKGTMRIVLVSYPVHESDLAEKLTGGFRNDENKT